MANVLKCPECSSVEIEALAAPEKKVSITKGLVGGALLGPLGAVAGGAVLGKKGKATLHCKKCGAIWEQKLK